MDPAKFVEFGRAIEGHKSSQSYPYNVQSRRRIQALVASTLGPFLVVHVAKRVASQTQVDLRTAKELHGLHRISSTTT